MSESLEYYQGLPYTIEYEMAQDDLGRPFWVAEIKEFEGCVGIGNTQISAANNLGNVFDDYVNKLIELGIEIPEPASFADRTSAPEQDFSPVPTQSPTRIVGAQYGKPAGVHRVSKPVNIPSNTNDRRQELVFA